MSDIPKIIHFCWFGGNPLPKLAEKCIKSWSKYCPDYQIIKWDETNFNIESNQYVKEAYKAKKFAFVSDYVRLYALYNYGGIYMDTDVEVLRSLDIFLGDMAFSGFENEVYIPTGIIGSVRHHEFFRQLLAYYDNRSFIREDGSYDLTTNVKIITGICINEGLVPNNLKQTILGFTLYPNDFFCPKNFRTGKVELTENSHTIHHFNSSWMDKERKLLLSLNRNLGTKTGTFAFRVIVNLLHPIKGVEKLISKTQFLFSREPLE